VTDHRSTLTEIAGLLDRRRARSSLKGTAELDMKRLNTYKAYTIGCMVAWAVLWVVVGTQASDHTRRTLLFVFLGWLLGWTSATIARSVYPPPGRKSN
jgi:hypothetical protein